MFVIAYIWQWEFCLYEQNQLPATFWKRIMILAKDDDPGRAWCSWQRMMILAEDHDPGRTACSRWNTMILLGNKEPLFKDHLGPTSGRSRDRFWPNSKIIFPSFVDEFGINFEGWLLEVGLYRSLNTPTKCQLPYVFIRFSTWWCQKPFKARGVFLGGSNWMKMMLQTHLWCSWWPEIDQNGRSRPS